MLRRRRLVCGAVGLIAGSIAAPSFAVPATRSGRATPRLSYLEPSGQVWRWHLWMPHTQRTLTTLLEPPKLVFWQAGEPVVWFVSGDDAWRLRWAESPSKPASPISEKLAPLPRHHGEPRALWIDRGTGRLRLALRSPVDAADVLPATDSTPPRYRLKDGSTVAGLATPDWGLPFVVSVHELAPGSADWTLVARRGTKDQAGDTPGLSVIDDLRREAGISAAALLDAYGCASGQCSEATPSPALRDAVVRAAAAGAQRPLDADAVTMLKRRPGKAGLAFGTVTGDSTHIRSPVLWTAANGHSRVALPTGERRQMALGLDDPWLLIADENGDRPMVFDMRTGRAAFEAPMGKMAMWVPQRSSSGQS